MWVLFILSIFLMVSFLAYRDQTKRYKDIDKIKLNNQVQTQILCFTKKTRFCSGTQGFFLLLYFLAY